MVRRVFFALLVSGIVAQSAFAQEQAKTGRGSLVGWLKSKVTGTSQPSQRSATKTDVQHAVAAATGRIATPQPRQQYRPTSTSRSTQYTPEQRAAAQRAAQQRAAQYRAAQYRAAQQRAAQERTAQQRAIQQVQYRTAQRPQVQQQRPASPQGPRPQMTPQQMQQYQAQVARARQYQAAQQGMRFASSGRTVPTRTTPMTRLRPTPASVPTRQGVPVRTVSRSSSGYMGGMPGYGSGYSTGAYPTTSAGLYSSPRPNVPYQMGMTAITNQALYPHEFLYPHEYNAVYPPYYYKVKGHWMVTPFGVWSQENWKPMGTEVNVKYRSSISPFAGFIPPMN